LRTPSLHPKHKKHNEGVPGGGAATPASTSAKSVTWRDEQTQSERNKVERDIVGCAANYCGLFKQGEGLADVLLTPSNKVGESSCQKKKKKKKPESSVLRKVSTSGSSVDGSISSGKSDSSENKKTTLTQIQTQDNVDENKLLRSKRILYDDLGNPIQEGDEDDATNDTFTKQNENSPPSTRVDVAPGTPSSKQTFRTEAVTPMAEKAKATVENSGSYPLSSFLCNMPMAVAGAANTAAAAMGYSSSLPSTLHRPSPTVGNSGASAEYMDDVGVYEPTNYDQPFPHSTEKNNSLAYKRIRSPPARRRHPTPRKVRHNSRNESEEDENGHYYCGSEVMEDGVIVQRLGKISRQDAGMRDKRTSMESDDAYNVRQASTKTRNTATSRRLRQGHIGEEDDPTTFYYEENDTPRSQQFRYERSSRSPGRRSDVYSDLTMDEGSYYSQKKEIDYEEEEYVQVEHNRSVPRTYSHRRQLDIQERETNAEENMANQKQQRTGPSKRRSRGVGYAEHPKVKVGADEEDQLSPREYAERYYRQRRSENNDEDEGDEENLSPRQFAEKYRERRNGDTRKAETVESDEQRSSEQNDKEDWNRYSENKLSKKNESSTSPDCDGDRVDTDPFWNSVKDARKLLRDPTPRNSMDPAESGYTKRQDQLPPTPRREGKQQSHPGEVNTLDATTRGSLPYNQCVTPVGASDFNQKSSLARYDEARDALIRQFSPRSMATDDEIREEVSSVGMASDTIRPLYYSDTFKDNSSPAIPESKNAELLLVQAATKDGFERETSTLSGSESTLSSKSSQKKRHEKVLKAKKKAGQNWFSTPLHHQSII